VVKSDEKNICGNFCLKEIVMMFHNFQTPHAKIAITYSYIHLKACFIH